MPASDGGDYLVGIGGPGEGPRRLVILPDEAIDGGVELDERAEHAALQPPPGELVEEAFDSIQPGARGEHEVEDEARASAHLRVLVGAIVVEDDVDDLADRHLRLDGIEEADELLVPMVMHVATNDGAVEHVESSEEGGGRVPPWASPRPADR